MLLTGPMMSSTMLGPETLALSGTFSLRSRKLLTVLAAPEPLIDLDLLRKCLP